MASRVQQDTFMDDADDSCPLCVEEFDLSDKNFRPCPCGYQLCQFCYNNIKTNLNGLCPACRREYQEENIEWKVVSPEEAKADLALQNKKKALAKQKETERRQVETLSRKHLAGLRVMQKNLVYVVGLNPKSREEDLLETLRGDQYFGQYGKIIKIVVGKAKEGANGNNSQGIYVTFAREEDAERCIKAVDGSQNGDRVLRAQFGTTKYCSAYLRNEACNNRSCMFLHDSGEGYNNVSRQDASKMNANAVAAQGPAPSSSSPIISSRPAQPQPPSQVAPANSQPMAKHFSQEQTISRSDSVDNSVLPTSASWATKNTYNESRRSSKAASISASSPVVPQAHLPSQAEDVPPDSPRTSTQPETSNSTPNSELKVPQSLDKRLFSGEPHPLDRVMKTVLNSSFKFTFDRSIYSEEALKEIDAYPPLFDANGGLVRYRLEKEREQERLKQEEDERKVLGALSSVDEDETPASGSLQLGGEPETQDRPNNMSGPSDTERSAIQPPYPSLFNGSQLLSNHSSNVPFNIRSLTPQQQQQLLQQRSASNHQSPINTQYQHGNSQHHHQPSNPFPNQTGGLGVMSHTRQASRYTFANDSTSASTGINPSTSAHLIAQQSTMMPSNQSKMFQTQAPQHSNLHSSHFYSGVQGPPPGLKSSGTPPISGGGMFGQGHGFTSAASGSLALGRATAGNKNGNDELMREFLRGRNGAINGQGPDVGKREFDFLSSVNQPKTSNATSASSLLSSLSGFQLGVYNGHQDASLQKQKKKGKKHRHANTSSSGGGGIVDLADPSILQARMHHGGAGQGQFGAQGQESLIVSRPEGITMSNEKSVKIAPNEVNPMSMSGMKLPKPSIQPSAAVPPGLSSPQDFPPLAAPQPVAPPKLQKKVAGSNLILGTIKPVVPVLPGQQSRALAPTKENRESLIAQKLEDISGATCSTEHEGIIEATAARPGAKPKLKAKQSVIGSSRKNAQSKSCSSESPAPNAAAAEPKPLSISVSENLQNLTEKRPHPGKLDITAAKDASKIEMESITSSSVQSKFVDPVSAISQPLTPATSLSSATRQIPSRTIRAISTPKAENPPRLIPASPSIVSIAASVVASKQISRRASLSSIHPPGTPVSEKISDNASFTSTSMSRANSPPPSKVGSAPVRQYTKSQQKKERQVRARQAEEVLIKKEDSSAKAITEEPVQAPIIGRKKKTKKPTRGTTDSTPAATRPSSPTPKDEVFQDRTRPTTPIKENYKEISAQKDTKESETPASPVASSSSDHHQKNLLAAASILSSLQKSGEVSSTVLDLFKGAPGINFRFEINQQDLAEQKVPVLSEAQRRQIESGDAVVLDMINNKRVVILPDHSTLPGLTEEEAQRYLELRQRILSSTELAKFNSTRCDIARYLHAGPQPANTAPPKPIRNYHTTEDLSVLVNRFVASASAPALAAATFPPYFNSSPLTDEGMQRAKDVQFETAEQDMLTSRKETEICEKKFNGLLKRNRRLLVGNSN